MKKWWVIATVLFAVLIVAIVIAANKGQFPHQLEAFYKFPSGDKAGHFILFGVLSFLLNKSALLLIPDRNPARIVLTFCLLLSILIGLEEWSQSLFPSRSLSLIDLISSYLGVFVFAVWAYRTRE